MIKEPNIDDLIMIEEELSNTNKANELNNPLSIYLTDIGKFELLTKSEEVELAKRILMAKDSKDNLIIKLGREARDQMIIANLRLVVSIAKRYAYNSGDLMDLIQDGTMGLMKAVDRFEFDKGFRFSTYATWWIRQSITRAVANNSRTIRLPVYIMDAMTKVKKIKREYVYECGIEPDIQTILKITNISKETLIAINIYEKELLSLDREYDEESTNLINRIGDKTNLPPDVIDKTKTLEEYFINILNNLTVRESKVIKMRFGFDGVEKTLEEIGEILNLTRERVRQIEKKALDKIRAQYLNI